MSRITRLRKEDFKLIIVASNIVELECLINEYFYSKYYVVSDDLKIHNSEKKYELGGNYYDWYLDFNKKFKIYKVKQGYKFYRYFGV